jgi:aldose 1-epimerase
LRPATPQALQQRDPLGVGSFPLAPWCNRIRDGHSRFGPLPVDLPPNVPNSPHTIHGTTWRHPWAVKAQGDDWMELVQQHHPAQAHDWPYAFDARQRLQLADDGLHVEIAVTNRSAHAMPAGIGHHPYFPHRPGTRLKTSVAAMWDSDAGLLPTQLVKPAFLPALADGLQLDELVLDNNFVGWERRARVDWPDDGAWLELRAQPPLDFFVLYSPRGADHFVMEGVSNCTDWMNLAARGIGNAGGTMLAPGATLAGRFSLVVGGF